MQPNQADDDLELLALADATDRVAEAVCDAVIRARLQGIADEIRAWGRHGGGGSGGPEMLQACFLPA